ncbi:MAG: alpha/beta hydrolase fold domain-containing protein [Ilumatobacteraceae bacterium]
MTNTTTSPLLPGRLGEPGRQLGDDPRADPRLIAAMAPLGLEVEQPSPVDATSPIDEIYAYCMEAETGFEQLGGILAAASPRIVGIERSVETITGVDGNEITLYVHRPADVAGPLPAVVHTHGGGMVILTAANAGYQRWRDELAATGLVVIGVEFRNGAGVLGNHPYPAGLHDCTSATRWVAANRDELGVDRIVLSGESGGGNLALATALSANRDGWIGEIAGVYAQCPYISGAYADPPPALTSLVENAGYLLSPDQLGAFARAYDPDGSHADDSLAWPLRAGRDDLAGLPPHVVSVNQLDPLRDEGLAFSGKLAAAGVSVVSRTVNGTCHAGDCLFRDALPEVYLATIRDIRGFAASL